MGEKISFNTRKIRDYWEMDGKKKKLPGSPVAQAAMRLFLADAGYEIRDINEPKYPKSKRRQWTSVMKTILNNFPFPNKQRRLLEALTSGGSLGINEIADATGSKAPRGLIRDTRKRIKSYQHLRNINIDIGGFRRSKKWLYHLKFS